MKDERIKEILNENPINQRISDEKLEADIQRVSPDDKTRPYLMLSEEIIRRADKRGIITEDGIKFDLLTDIEKQTVRYIREASSQDRTFLKGDLGLGNYLENKIIKYKTRKPPKPPQKRLQFTASEIADIFELKSQGMHLYQIAEKYKCSRKTISRLFKNDYVNEEDRKIVSITRQISEITW